MAPKLDSTATQDEASVLRLRVSARFHQNTISQRDTLCSRSLLLNEREITSAFLHRPLLGLFDTQQPRNCDEDITLFTSFNGHTRAS